MTKYYDENGEEVDLSNEVLNPQIRERVKLADKLEKENQDLQAQLAQAAKDSAFISAGIPGGVLGDIFRRGYVGDLTQEAIRKTAEEAGILQAPAAVLDPSLDAELEAQRRIAGSTIGSTGATPDSEQEFMAKLGEAKNAEEVMAVVSGDLGRKVQLRVHDGQL